MHPVFRVGSLVSSAGDRAELPPVGVTCVVGANNAGKSRLLRDIVAFEDDPDGVGGSVTLVDVEARMGLVDEAGMRAWLDHGFVADPLYGWSVPGIPNNQISLPTMMSYQNQNPLKVHGRSSFFIRHISAGSSLAYASNKAIPQENIGHPLAVMYKDGSIIEELSRLSKRYFGSGLTYDRVNREARIRFGEISPEIVEPPISRPSTEYAAAVEALKPLEDQGDGIRAFMGIALRLMTDPAQVFLLDEPEAFLHPAQARALGTWIAKKSLERGIQIIIATHDRDLVLGVMEELSGSSIAMLRVSRVENLTHFANLDSAAVEASWSDPTLRYSNVLQGLFHQTVVVCEGDADCRFFSAALDAHAERLNRRFSASEALFIPTGGKPGLKKPAAALRKLDVDVKVIADFDLLDERETVKGLVVSLGADWTQAMQVDYGTFRGWVRKNIADWQIVKKGGISAIYERTASIALMNLLTALEERGIHALRVGEMEDFDRSVDAPKSAPWVTAAIAANVHADNHEVRQLMARMFPWTPLPEVV